MGSKDKFDNLIFGPVAHLVEHIICNDGVAGSSPVGSTTNHRKVVFVTSKRVAGSTRVRTRSPIEIF